MTTLAKRIARAIDDMNPASPALARLLELVGDAEAPVSALAEAVALDPTIAAGVLRMANSAELGLRQQISSIQHAVSLVGLRRMHELVLGCAFGASVPPAVPGYDVDACQFILHSVATGKLAEQLATSAGVTPEVDPFAAGLLHDYGKLALGGLLEDNDDERLADARVAMVDAERLAAGADHCQVGGRVARRWGLPSGIVDAIRWHHDPLSIPEEKDWAAAALVHVADVLSQMMGLGQNTGHIRCVLDSRVLDRLELQPSDVESAMVVTLDEIERIAEVISREVASSAA